MKTLRDGEWVFFAKEIRISCCDCGLAHHVKFIITKDQKLMSMWERDKKQTKENRKEMRIKFLKKHLTFNKDDETEIDDKAAKYLVRVKAAEEVKEESPEEMVDRWEKEREEKAEIQTIKEKKITKPAKKPEVKGPKTKK